MRKLIPQTSEIIFYFGKKRLNKRETPISNRGERSFGLASISRLFTHEVAVKAGFTVDSSFSAFGNKWPVCLRSGSYNNNMAKRAFSMPREMKFVMSLRIAHQYNWRSNLMILVKPTITHVHVPITRLVSESQGYISTGQGTSEDSISSSIHCA